MAERSGKRTGAAPQYRIMEANDQTAQDFREYRADGDTFRFMIATDNHAGYLERDPVRGNDSFAALEEIFIRAKEYNVDAVILGGDLFHDNKPSRKAMHTVIGILRRNCLGDAPVSFEVISDQAENFKSGFGTVNYEDPNYAVSLPVFCIHGNHDDPSREGAADPLSALDLLSVNNLINYFGKSEATNNIEVNPVLLRKGRTQVALYGLGNIRDERLNRMWGQNKVKFLTHSEGIEPFWNMFVLHQNRDCGRGPKNCVHESMLPDWMDLVMWGHEHACEIAPREASYGRSYIIQPGSSVATSLVEGEAQPKMVAVIEVYEQKFRALSVPLQNVRPFVLGEVELAREGLDSADPQVEDRMSELLAAKVEELIAQARHNQPEPPPLPGQQIRMTNFDQVLVRLKVDHTGFPTLNNQRFGARFVGQVANPTDLLLFHKRKKVEERTERTERADRAPSQPRDYSHLDEDRLEIRVEDLVRAQIEASDKKLTLLNEPEMYIALEDFVNKNSSSAIMDAVEDTLELTQKQLNKEIDHSTDDFDIAEKAAEVQERQRRKAEAKLKAKGDRAASHAPTQTKGREKAAPKSKKKAKDDEEEEDEEPEEGDAMSEDDHAGSKASKASEKSRKTTTSHATTASRGGGASRAKPRREEEDEIVDLVDDDDDDVDEAPRKPPPTARPRSKPAPRAAATKKKSKYADEDDEFSEQELSEEEEYGHKDAANEESDDDEFIDDEDDSDMDGGRKKGKAARKPAAGRGKATTAKKAATGTTAARGRGRGASAAASRAKKPPPAPKPAAVTSKLPWARDTGSKRGSQSQASQKRARAEEDDDEVEVIEDDEGPVRKRRPGGAARRPADEDEDEDFDIDTLNSRG